MTTLREAAQQALEALEFLSLDFFMLGPISPGRESTIKAITALRAALAEPVQEPVAWAGYDLDAMADAFSRVIEAHHSSRHPFHNPLDMDARMALRILRGVIPAMKATTAPPQRKPLTEEEIESINRDLPLLHMKASKGSVAVVFARAIERAHGIGEQP